MRNNICRAVRLKEAKYVAISKERHGGETLRKSYDVLMRCNCKRLAVMVLHKINSANVKKNNKQKTFEF